MFAPSTVRALIGFSSVALHEEKEVQNYLKYTNIDFALKKPFCLNSPHPPDSYSAGIFKSTNLTSYFPAEANHTYLTKAHHIIAIKATESLSGEKCSNLPWNMNGVPCTN